MNSENPISGDQSNKKPEQNNESPHFRDLLSVVSIGLVILGLVQISTNGVYTFYSDIPGFQLYPFFVFACAGIWYLAFQTALRLKNVPWIFMVASVACSVFFVIATKQVDTRIEEMRDSKRAADRNM